MKSLQIRSDRIVLSEICKQISKLDFPLESVELNVELSESIGWLCIALDKAIDDLRDPFRALADQARQPSSIPLLVGALVGISCSDL